MQNNLRYINLSWAVVAICEDGTLPLSTIVHDGQDEVEAGEGLDWWMVGNVAVYLLSGLGAEYIILTWHEAVLIHKGDVPKGHIADDVMLYGCGLILLDAGDAGRKGLVGILTNAHHSPREISVEFCYAMSLIIPVCKN